MDGDDFASIQLLGTLNDGFKSNDFNTDVAKYFRIFQEESIVDHTFTIDDNPRNATNSLTISNAINNIKPTNQACHVVFHPSNSQQLGSIKQEFTQPIIYDPSFQQQDLQQQQQQSLQQQQQSAVDFQYYCYDDINQQYNNIHQPATNQTVVDIETNNLLVAQNITGIDSNNCSSIIVNSNCSSSNNDNSVLLVPDSKTLINTFIKCQNCNLKFKSQETHDIHARCHSQNGTNGFNCYLCEFTRKKWASLANHLWSAHKIDLELSKCDKCEYRTYSQSILDRVHLATHSEERNFLCETCDKRFKTIKQLQNHKVTYHLNMAKPINVTIV